jgi:hypothetical protein
MKKDILFMYKASLIINGTEEAAVFASTEKEALTEISSYVLHGLCCKHGEKFEVVLTEVDDV